MAADPLPCIVCWNPERGHYIIYPADAWVAREEPPASYLQKLFAIHADGTITEPDTPELNERLSKAIEGHALWRVYQAASHGHLDQVPKEFLTVEIMMVLKDCYGQTALHNAARVGQGRMDPTARRGLY